MTRCAALALSYPATIFGLRKPCLTSYGRCSWLHGHTRTATHHECTNLAAENGSPLVERGRINTKLLCSDHARWRPSHLLRGSHLSLIHRSWRLSITSVSFDAIVSEADPGLHKWRCLLLLLLSRALLFDRLLLTLVLVVLVPICI